VFVGAWPAGAGATEITVNATDGFYNASDGKCTIYEAVVAANNNAASGPGAGECPAGSTQPDTIHLPAGFYQAAGLSINGDGGPLTLAGAGASTTHIGQPQPATVDVTPSRLMAVSGANAVAIRDVSLGGGGNTLSGFPTAEFIEGAAIRNTGTLTVERCTFTHNKNMGAAARGGAIFSSGSLTVRDSTFTDNWASGGTSAAATVGTQGPNASPGGAGGSVTGDPGSGGGGGGAIANTGTLVVERSVFTDNHAGAGGSGGNATGGKGGNGVNPSSSGGVGGSATGGIGGHGGSGGAIWSSTGATGSVTIVDSWIYGNFAGYGGQGGSATGGQGGQGGSGGIGPGGTGGVGGAAIGGPGGPGGSGGGVYIRSFDNAQARPVIESSLISGNTAGVGGQGWAAHGGGGGLAGTGAAAGNGGAGGAATGGAGGTGGDAGGLRHDFSLTGAVSFDTVAPYLENVTITGNHAGPGGPALGTANAGLFGGTGGFGTNGGSQGATGAITGGNGGTGGRAGALSYDVLVATHLTVSSNAAGTGTPGADPGGSSGTTGTDGGLYRDGFTDTGQTNTALSSNGILANSIVASNSPSNCADNNLTVADTISFPSGVCGSVHTDPLLGALADNGGPTQTQALGNGSPAVDFVTGPDCAATDGRGVLRPQLGTCDAGAYEVAPPAATTGDATSVASTSATIAGSVNPNQRATSYHFEFGPTDSYGSSSATENLSAGNSPVGVSADLSSLAPSTTYHYRLVASNADGATAGPDRTFTTPAAAATDAGDPGGPAPGGSTTPGESTNTPGPGDGSTGQGSVADTVAPKLSSVSLKPLKLRKSGVLKFSLSEAAKVTLTIQSLKPNRRVARLTISAIRGANRKTITRTIGKKRLRPGRYRITLEASDATGNRSTLKVLTFQVV
jgi:hypothetical protein